MAKKLIVPIVADSAAFKRGLKESETAAQQFEGKIKGTTSHVRTHILSMGAAFIGVGGLVEGLKKSVEAAVELDQATSQMDAQLKQNGENARAYTSQIEKMNAQMEKVGFTNAQAEEAFSRLDRSTGNAAQAFKYMGVTADLAAVKHIALSQAALVVGKVIQGTTTAMNRYGIVIPKGTSATEALRIAQQKLTGQAAAMAKPTEVFSTIITDLEAKIGKALLPTIDKYMTRIENWIGQAQNQKKITDAVKLTLTDLGLVLSALKATFDRIFPVLQKVRDMFGSWKPLIVAAGVALVALGLLSPWTALAAGAVYVITHWKQVKGWFSDFWGWMKTGWRDAVDVIKGIFYGWVAAVIGELKLLADGAAKALGWLPGIGGKLKDAAKAVDGWYSNFADKSKSAFGDIGASSANAFANSYISTLTAQQAAMAAAAGGTGTSASATNDSRRQGGHSTAAPAGATYTQAQMAALLVKAGASPQLAGILANIGHNYESGGQSGVVSGVNSNGTRDYGLFQINSAHGYSKADMLNPMQNAREALSIYHSQGFGAWTEAGGRAAVARYGNWLSASSGGGGGALPGDAAAAAADAKAKSAAERKAKAAATAAAAAAYKSWKENYFTPLDNAYKSDLLVTNESKRLNKLQALHAKLAIDLKNTTGKEHQDILNEENKVAGKIMSLRQKMANEQKAILAKQHADYVKGLQDDLQAAQTGLARQQTVFDRAFSRIAAKLTSGLQAQYAAATPEEQARDAFKAQLDAAQRAADIGSANDDLIAAQLSGDPVAIKAAQAHLDDIQNQQKLADLQVAADRSRAIQDAAGQTALDNLNDWLADQKTALEGGTQTWDGFWQAAFSDAPAKYAPDAVSSLQGVIDQQNEILRLQGLIDGGGSSSKVSLPGGLNVPAGILGHGFGGAFANGGIVPGSLGQPMLILAHGGERVIPNGGGGGGHTFNISFPQYVGSRDELARTLRDELVTLGRREPNIFGGFA